MGLSASQGRMLLLTARKSDLEYRAQQISQKRLVLSQQLEEISCEYEDATSNRQMKISLSLTSAGADDDVVKKTTNLTYAALVSGTLAQFSSEDSGIKPYERTENQEYASTSAYRLVDAYGAIVVSSVDEIPGAVSKDVNVNTSQDKDGIYRVTTTDAMGNRQKTGSSYVLPLAGSALANYLDEDKTGEIIRNNLQIDTKQGLIELKKQTGDKVYYNYLTGALASQAEINGFSSSELATIANNANAIPQSVVKQASNAKISEGSDGRFSLLDANGVVVARYVVDSSLKYGTTDSAGATDGPNYLQDCLRNGKYLIEKGNLDSETQKVKWRSLSWDATANISDSYYTQDDDKAKAKYDRLQTQIQNQDKKLELELDSIETQRSAVTTEVDSVKKVIDDNIEGSFKAFA